MEEFLFSFLKTLRFSLLAAQPAVPVTGKEATHILFSFEAKPQFFVRRHLVLLVFILLFFLSFFFLHNISRKPKSCLGPFCHTDVPCALKILSSSYRHLQFSCIRGFRVFFFCVSSVFPPRAACGSAFLLFAATKRRPIGAT